MTTFIYPTVAYVVQKCIKSTAVVSSGRSTSANSSWYAGASYQAHLTRLRLLQHDFSEFRQADSKTKSILFGLCHFHAIMMERKLYGPMGFNMMYPFSIGDLRDSAVCLTNYMENSGGGKIPWQDLKYIFGEIMCV